MKDCKCCCNFTEQVKESSVAVWLLALCSFLLGVLIGSSCARCTGKCCGKKKSGKCCKSKKDENYDNFDDYEEFEFDEE